MKTTPEENEQLVREFIGALQHRDSPDVLGRFYHLDAEQSEFPNLTTKGKSLEAYQTSKQPLRRARNYLPKKITRSESCI